ncbi:hypothetical protein FSP39_012808 [Pinctada imbricata]|uniref:Reverse transcriptase domain-containing protein n=1 Tax=Pinctada imbricata TaxID=66713 RepID=A0AA88XYQ9_PINIB|nr:hypothetical protein FSP39_012808 [Pinctada imbricata]
MHRYKQLKQATRAACRSAYNDYISNIISPESQSKPKKFWSFISSKRKESSGVAPLGAEDGKTYSESTTKANILNQQFTSVFNPHDDITTIPTMSTPRQPPMENISIETKGVEKLLAGLNIHKAAGPDGIPTRILKLCSSELAPVFATLFQSSLHQGILPADWKKADVAPIFKKGMKNCAANYRPVSLTSVACKVMEHIVCSNIMRHCDQHHIITDAQHGFRKRRSCETQLIVTLQDLTRNVDNKGQTDVILLDFAKAFDKVPHERLLFKINHYGISGTTLTWIRNFLHQREQRVVLDGCTSETAPVSSGVPQGSVLGPLLFLLFINDLPDYVSHANVRLFADDCILYRRIDSDQDPSLLQQDLDALQRWEEDWLMQFHPHKCQVLHITHRKSPVKSPYNIHGHQLEEVEAAKYLGISIHQKLTWNNHINQVTDKANNTRAFLQRNIYQCPKEIKVLCYNTLVRPIMEYGGIIWDPSTAHNINRLEMVQRRAARFVMGDYHTTSSVTTMMEQLGWRTLQERRAQAKAVMMFRIVNQLVDIPHTYLTPARVSVRGHSQRFTVPHTRTTTYRHSFFPDSIRIWNALPQDAISCNTLESFKASLQPLHLR